MRAARNHLVWGFLALLVAQASAAAGERRLDLNRATARELVMLPHIGPHRAKAIIRRREQKPFKRVSELLQVKGIGRKIYYRIRSFVYVGQAKVAEPPSEAKPGTKRVEPKGG